MTTPDGESVADALERWLSTRAESAPPSLRVRLLDAVRDGGGQSGGAGLADTSCRAGESLLAKLLAEGCASRSAALDLLAADALVTYAFEAAAELPAETAASVDARAADAMRRIAMLGTTVQP
ncbi:MAG TPA: hypothetical protein VHM30_12230 [Gemmatimonadaceae bacterium]|nr:hypothetical protein [Gemmatimonadaceae bacterium]